MGGGFLEVNFEKKCVDKNERDADKERERQMRERVRVGEGGGCACKDKACEDGLRKKAPFETVNFRRESILSIHRQVSKRAKAHACQIQVQDMIQSFLERERERER